MPHGVETRTHSLEAFLKPLPLAGVSFFAECPDMISLLQRGRPPFPMERRPSSLVGSYSNPGWENRILLRERPAHQCRNGSDLSILFASDAPTDLSRFRGPCHLPFLA